MFDKNKLDSILDKLVTVAEKELDRAIERGTSSKDLVESVSVVLSVAYGRVG